jgi:lipopolysaccharide transport system ATP-binding protein
MDKLLVESLGKSYDISGTSSDKSAPSFMRRQWQRLRRRAPEPEQPEKPKEFWALKDVAFTVEPGTVLGVIGANGAGKTTLLKVLARVVTPTEGRVAGSGRVVSLLELGAGFDPDLTARDNIYLNGAMLGVPRAVVARRFDHIIEFAEVGKFVDTPLKHYSSGMYLRLAFSVAINMEPSILLADEILAVGDLSFQDRCLERVKQEAERGLTVLFVSHDMEAIMRVCTKVLWLNGGRVLGLGEPEDIIAEYQNSEFARGMQGVQGRGRHTNKYATIHDLRIVAEDGREVRGVKTSEEIYLRLRFELFQDGMYARAAFDLQGRGLLLFRGADAEPRHFPTAGAWEALMRMPANFLSEMAYSIVGSLTVSVDKDARPYTLVMPTLSFLVYGPEGTTMASTKAKETRAGLLTPRFRWTFRPMQDLLQEPETDSAGE